MCIHTKRSYVTGKGIFMNKKSILGRIISAIILFILFDIHTIFSFVLGKKSEEYLDWIRLGAGDYSDIPFFSIYGFGGKLLIVGTFIILLFIFCIILNSPIVAKLEMKSEYLIPIAVGFMNAVIFFFFMKMTYDHWLTWFAHERTAPYTVDGFAKGLVYSNSTYYVGFILENILFLVAALVSLFVRRVIMK